MTIADLKKSHQRASIQKISGDSAIIQRIQEVGLHEGDSLTFVGRAPFGGAFIVRVGSLIVALRKEEALCTQIQVID